MKLRADHVAGAFFVVIGALVAALSGDLPFGTLEYQSIFAAGLALLERFLTWTP